ncbi:MAG: glycosyltransferase family 2 protein [Deltaproteobacteria bacterium HGW-Deltaproteobacteria-12]|nr:MAG: glycosyltransferase family 2 protein [Deltaproteobacteria bacterium HGW-Deltaproteobacteria-12]
MFLRKKLIQQDNTKGRFAFVVPVYNHAGCVAHVIRQTQTLGFPVFVVNDGSTDNTADEIKDIPGIRIISHKKNMGKGAALMSGFAAAAIEADWAITIDADGQHYPEDALKLIAAIPQGTRAIVVGTREGMAGEHVPWTSRFGRKFSNFWVWLSGGPVLSDSQSGMRLYPLPEAIVLPTKAQRFQFEVEILVQAKRKKLTVLETSIRVVYNPDGSRISHFRPFVDFIRNSLTFTRLIFTRIFSLR